MVLFCKDERMLIHFDMHVLLKIFTYLSAIVDQILHVSASFCSVLE